MKPSNTQSITEIDAARRLGKVLDRVEAGEELVILRNGEPVAKLVPVDPKSDQDLDRALRIFRGIRHSLIASGRKVSQKEIRRWKTVGRLGALP